MMTAAEKNVAFVYIKLIIKFLASHLIKNNFTQSTVDTFIIIFLY